ncbi:MAG: crotonobetainyl-CoA--carnitine CoA-transferase [Alphaproteobacteria bacterium]|nr:crotonobetainyl-CoA--carnitine CoA-transferase [Alphaproteobacteria bacterium]
MVYTSGEEKKAEKRFFEMLSKSPVPDDEILFNLGLFLTSRTLSRILFFNEIYKKIVHTHGVAIEFGARWGQTVSVLAALRGIYEPFNRHRKILAFDSFSGLKGVAPQDGDKHRCKDGSYDVPEGYEKYLQEILGLQEALNPVSHVRKHEVIAGDVCETFPAYLERHPETMVSLAIFDLDIYSPTKAMLEAVKPRLFKGSVLVFDELCDEVFPGETTALIETFGLNGLRIERMPMTARLSYAVIE